MAHLTRPTALSAASPEAALLNEFEAAAYLGSTAKTLRKWRCVGCGPRFIKMNRSVRYAPRDLEAFISEGRRSSTSDRGAAA